MFIIDAHLNLGKNALEWNRDLRQPIDEINEREKYLTDKPGRGNALVSLPELRKGTIGLVVTSLNARCAEPGNSLSGWHSQQQAWAQTQGQKAWYEAMEEEGEMIQINNLQSLINHLALWNDGTLNQEKPVGYILSLEGTDSLITLEHLERAYEYGLRVVGLARYGRGRYAPVTNDSGYLSKKEKELLKKMERLNIILDATHLYDDSFGEALNHFNGHVWASHTDVQSLVNHNRQYTDQQIGALINRDAVIGVGFDARMLFPNGEHGNSSPEETNCGVELIINHIDHICQIAGNARHVGIGSNLDGAFGRQQSMHDLETIADLQKLTSLLGKRGYPDKDISNIMHGNWIRFLRNAWK